MIRIISYIFALLFVAPAAFGADGAISRVVPSGESGASSRVTPSASGRASVSSRVATNRNVASRDTATDVSRAVSSRVATTTSVVTPSRMVKEVKPSATVPSRGASVQSRSAAPQTVSRGTSVQSRSATPQTVSRGASSASARSAATSANAKRASRSRVSISNLFGGTGKSASDTATPASNISTEELMSLTDYCKAQYTDCMDQFCNVLDDSQGRCSCSRNIKNYAETEAALKTITEELRDIAQQIQYLGLTTDQVESLFTETSAEFTLSHSTDNSKLNSSLNKLKDMIVEVKSGTPSSTGSSSGNSLLSGFDFDVSGLLNFSFDGSGFDFANMFNGGNSSSTSSISNQRGEQLYKTASARCAKSVLETCRRQGVDTSIVTNSYDLEIDKQCLVYERDLREQNEEMALTISNARSVLQRARLVVAQRKNAYGLRECVTELDACMQDEFVCGSDYINCLDPSGKYIVEGTIVSGSQPGVPGGGITGSTSNAGGLYMTWNYGSNNAWGNGSVSQYVDKYLTGTYPTRNLEYMSNYLHNKIGYIDDEGKAFGMCSGVLNQCQDYTFVQGKYQPNNTVIRQYLERTLTKIKASQDKVLKDYAEDCVSDVQECLSENSGLYATSGTDGNPSVVAINACKSVITTCRDVTGYASTVSGDINQWLNIAFGYKLDTTGSTEGSGNNRTCEGLGQIYSNGSCICNSAGNFVANGTNGCKCQDGYTYDSSTGGCVVINVTPETPTCTGYWTLGTNNKCVCDETRNWTSDGSGACKCKTDYLQLSDASTVRCVQPYAYSCNQMGGEYSVSNGYRICRVNGVEYRYANDADANSLGAKSQVNAYNFVGNSNYQVKWFYCATGGNFSGAWTFDYSHCACASGYAFESGKCVSTVTELVNPYVSSGTSSETTMVPLQNITVDDTTVAIVQDTETTVCYASVADASGNYNTSASGACVVDCTTRTTSSDVCDDDNVVTILNTGVTASTYSMTRANNLPKWKFNGANNEEQQIKLSLGANRTLPESIPGIVGLYAGSDYVLDSVRDKNDSTKTYYDSKGKRVAGVSRAEEGLVLEAWIISAASAKPEDNHVKILYNLNGGTGTVSAHTCTANQTCELNNGTDKLFYKNGYRLVGWDKEGQWSLTPTANTTLKAVWEPCAAGTYKSSGMASGVCIPCGNGYYQPSTGQAQCLECKGGTVALNGTACKTSSNTGSGSGNGGNVTQGTTTIRYKDGWEYLQNVTTCENGKDCSLLDGSTLTNCLGETLVGWDTKDNWTLPASQITGGEITVKAVWESCADGHYKKSCFANAKCVPCAGSVSPSKNSCDLSGVTPNVGDENTTTIKYIYKSSEKVARFETACYNGQECPLSLKFSDFGETGHILVGWNTKDNWTLPASQITGGEITVTAVWEPCPVGTHGRTGGSTFCYPCGVGMYQDETGHTSCKPCSGTVVNNGTGCEIDQEELNKIDPKSFCPDMSHLTFNKTNCEATGGAWVDRSHFGLTALCVCRDMGLEQDPTNGLCRCANCGTYQGSSLVRPYFIASCPIMDAAAKRYYCLKTGGAYWEPTNHCNCPSGTVFDNYGCVSETGEGAYYDTYFRTCSDVLMVDGYECVKNDRLPTYYKYVLKKTTQHDTDYLEYPVRTKRPGYGKYACSYNKPSYSDYELENINPDCSYTVFSNGISNSSSSIKTTVDKCWGFVSTSSTGFYNTFRNVDYEPLGILNVGKHPTKLYSAQCMFVTKIPSTGLCYMHRGFKPYDAGRVGDRGNSLMLIDCSLLNSMEKEDMVYQGYIQSGGGLSISFEKYEGYNIAGDYAHTKDKYEDLNIKVFIPLDKSKKPASLAHYVENYKKQNPSCKFKGVFGGNTDMSGDMYGGDVQYYDEDGNWIENAQTAAARTPYVGTHLNLGDSYLLWNYGATAKWDCNDDITVSFDLNGWDGDVLESINCRAGQPCVTPELNRAGYVFMGWSTNSSASEGFGIFTNPTKDTKLYAIWQECPAGTKQNSSGCDPCPDGTYQPYAGSDPKRSYSCLKCNGTVSDDKTTCDIEK